MDPELMRNCITNFITNAAQAMPDGGMLVVSAERDETPGWVRLGFKDQAAVLPEKIWKRSFNRILPPRMWGSVWGWPLPSGL